MSMQHRLPEQAVPPDPWTLFCAECSQKMRIMMAIPAQREGKHARTSASAVTAKGLAWSFIDGEAFRVGFRGFLRVTKNVHENECTRDNPDDKGSI